MRRTAIGIVLAGLACGGLGTRGDPWDGASTFVCEGSEHRRLEGHRVEISRPGALAIQARGRCVLEVVDCEITADYPLEASGNAQVVIRGGRIHGREQALQARGNAIVTVDGATIAGEVAVTENGQVNGWP